VVSTSTGRAGLPRDLRPMLAVAGAMPPDDGRWAYEVKWDGVRTLVAVAEGRLTLTSRNGNDVTASYPELAGLASQLTGRSLLLDGEIVALDANGRSDFGLLQGRMHVGRPSTALLQATPVQLVLFDVLHLDGRSLLDAPYADRREILNGLGLTGPHWSVPPAFDGDGDALLAATKQQGLEGLVAKRRDARYLPGRRSDGWRKVKHVRRTSAVVAGWKPGEGGRAGLLGSLLLGVQGPDGLEYAGHVGTGFTAATLDLLTDLLGPLQRPDPPFATAPTRADSKDAVWVEPLLVAEVDYTEWTRDGRLRHPSYKGLRDDLDPKDVHRE
jgi:bifunctional non-homologous end joining protein LigD